MISDKLDEEGIKIFQENGFEVDKNFTITPEDLAEKIKDYDAIVIRSRTKLTAKILENAKNLKVIGRAGVGLDNIDLQKADELKIKVLNTPEAPSVSVAELTVGFMLSHARYITKADKTMHEGKWCKNDYTGNTLKGKKLGLIGFGNIGQAVAKRCAAFEMEVGIFEILPELKEKARNLGYTVYPSIEDLIKNVHFISLHVPANKLTENLINEDKIKLMNENTVIINTGRGKLIDEKALINALKNKKIAGAALDVFREEPLKNEELYSIDENLILTPHIGSSTEETQTSAAIGIAEKISDYLKK
ncbi:MAG: hydroxyacid dehydrogenase [Promethearchaeota archaeon]